MFFVKIAIKVRKDKRKFSQIKRNNLKKHQTNFYRC